MSCIFLFMSGLLCTCLGWRQPSLLVGLLLATGDWVPICIFTWVLLPPGSEWTMFAVSCKLSLPLVRLRRGLQALSHIQANLIHMVLL